jgi:cell division protein FtsN
MSVQRSGFLMGLIVGLLVGLSLALAVALYVSKVPVPFVNKVPQRTADQDAAEAEKNKNWDPNGALRGKQAQPAASSVNPAAPAVAGKPLPGGAGTAPAGGALPPEATGPRGPAPASARDPAAILGDLPVAPAGIAAARAASAPSTKPLPDPFIYFVQAGAYGQSEDAEQQRARLAMLGLEARLSEREQAGKTMYRVRIGPFDRKDEAEAAKEKLSGAGVEAALVRVQK